LMYGATPRLYFSSKWFIYNLFKFTRSQGPGGFATKRHLLFKNLKKVVGHAKSWVSPHWRVIGL
jgi:hypothetical protein